MQVSDLRCLYFEVVFYICLIFLEDKHLIFGGLQSQPQCLTMLPLFNEYVLEDDSAFNVWTLVDKVKGLSSKF